MLLFKNDLNPLSSIEDSGAASVEQSSIKCLCELGTTFHLSSQLLGIICLHKSHTILQKKLNPVLRKKNKMKGLIFNSFLSTLKMLKPIIKFTNYAHPMKA